MTARTLLDGGPSARQAEGSPPCPPDHDFGSEYRLSGVGSSTLDVALALSCVSLDACWPATLSSSLTASGCLQG
eukprot:755623-Hanusia_phi.AAC.2